MIDLMFSLENIARLLFALAMGALIGFERQKAKKAAGLRTHMLVSLGSALIMIISISIEGADPSRIAAGMITGIGFLGAGAIIATKGHVKGLTTAACIWIAAAIGMASGLGAYILALLTTIIVFVVLKWIGEIEEEIK